MALVSDRCICLRKVEYSESSQILALLSREHGTIRVIAKGAHRKTKAGASKFDGGVDLLDAGTAVFTGDSSRELATLTEWKLDDGHLALRKNLRGVYLGLYAAELACELFEEHDPHPEVFDGLTACLAELGAARREEIFLAWQIDLLRLAGFMPELTRCNKCGATELKSVGFSPERGGIVCQDCLPATADRMPMDIRLLRLLQSIAASAGRRLPQLTRHQTDPLNAVLARHVEQTLQRRLRMPQYVLSRIKNPPIKLQNHGMREPVKA